MASTPTRRRASAARRPETQPTRPKRSASPASSSRARAGTAASSGRVAIGARVPSTSVRIAARRGSARKASKGDKGSSIAMMVADRTVKLAAIGTLAGIFSGLFGVGGGTIVVPLLILWFGFGERLATGTSLAAIVLIGALGALAQDGLYGNVHVGAGLLLSIPAVLGIVAGTALQQRISERAVSLLFAALLVAIAIELIVP